MKRQSTTLLFLLLAAVFFAAAACGQTAQQTAQQTPAPKAPQITLTSTRIVHPARFHMNGTGFTPLRNAFSHLKRPDGTEFPVLTILSDAKGQFTHEIESLLLAIGTHELWVFDEATGAQTSVTKFEVVRE